MKTNTKEQIRQLSYFFAILGSIFLAGFFVTIDAKVTLILLGVVSLIISFLLERQANGTEF